MDDIDKYKKLDKIKKLWSMNELLYKEISKVKSLNEALLLELDDSENQKKKFKEKNNKLWSQSIAIHKEKDRINELKQDLEHRNKEILDSINYALRIQKAILPARSYLNSKLPDHFILYLPKDIVAGDFFWFEVFKNEETNKEKLMIAAADCTGHGVPGALVSVICINALNRSVREFGITDPAEILNKTRDIVIEQFDQSEDEVQDGMDISIAVIDLDESLLHWAGANNPLWIVRNGELVEIKGDKQPIGKYNKVLPFNSHKVELNKSDTIYMFTDGFADQFGGERGKKLKSSSFKKILIEEMSSVSIKDQGNQLERIFNDWKADIEQLDDVCVIGIEF